MQLLDAIKSRTPYFVDAALWTVTHLDDLAFALLRGSIAIFTRPEHPVYERIARLASGEDPPGTRIRRLPRAGRYLVVSDHHLLYAEAPHDYFGGQGRRMSPFRNERIYARMMQLYAEGGWTLVENGDVEDLVVPEPAFDRTDCLRAGAIGRVTLGLDRSLRISVRKRQLLRIVHTYAGYYRHLLATFGADRIVKLIGNHDTELLSGEFSDLLPLAGVAIHEFAVVEGGADGPPVVICHGHQMDPWTCQATAQGVGESITESFSWLGQGADRIWDTRDWGPPLHAENHISRAGFGKFRGIVPKVRHMSEARVMVGLAELTSKHGVERPWLILGHTHEPRFRLDERYVNTAAAGRYQDLVWASEVDHGAPRLVAWWVEQDGREERLIRGVLVQSGDWLSCVEREDRGFLPPLPYPARPTSLAAIDVEVERVVPRGSRSLVWLAARIALNLAFLATVAGACAGAWSLAHHR